MPDTGIYSGLSVEALNALSGDHLKEGCRAEGGRGDLADEAREK
jgi:hypothetical protein